MGPAGLSLANDSAESTDSRVDAENWLDPMHSIQPTDAIGHPEAAADVLAAEQGTMALLNSEWQLSDL